MTLRPPNNLSERAIELWETVNQRWNLDVHHEVLLAQACRTLTEIDELEAIVADAGFLLDGRFGKKGNPAVTMLRQHRTALGQLLDKLRLEES